MHLTGDQMPFSKESRRSNPWRILFYVLLIAGGIWFTSLVEAERVHSPFMPTPTPTRIALSYVKEGQTYFSVGDLNKAIEAYQNAANLDPNNGRLWAELARTQTYSSELRTNLEERQQRLAEARQSIDRAVKADPDDSYVQAIRAFVYDWSASAVDAQDIRQAFLKEAEEAAVHAKHIDPDDVLGLAFYAEVLSDRNKWAQAIDVASQAAEQAETRSDIPNQTMMDIHRVYGAVLEANGRYPQAIEEYKKAAEIAPALTFLYLRIGANYRELKRVDPANMDKALEYFTKAAQINEQLGIEDPIPYLAIGKTYMQDGEFFIAAINIAKALRFASDNPDIYGRLGIVYFKARNYESALDVLKCAVAGCSEEEDRKILCETVYGCDPEAPEALQYGQAIDGLMLDSSTVVYYYTYGSALAFYGYCDEAEDIFKELMTIYGSDPIVASIVAENRAICDGTLPAPASTATPIPGTPIVNTPTASNTP